MNRDRRKKKKSNKRSSNIYSKIKKFVLSPIGKIISILASMLTSFGLVDQYNKHVDLEVELSSIVHIIVEGDQIPAPRELEDGRLVFGKIDKKLAFIRSSQRQAHLNSFSLHYPRFTNIDSFTSLGTLRSASQSFRQIEKDNHKNFVALEAKSNWMLALQKIKDSEKHSMQTLASIPIKLLAHSRFFDKETSSHLRTSAGEVKGIYTDQLPKPLVTRYPVLDLSLKVDSSKEFRKVPIEMISLQPKGRYFIPTYTELTNLEKTSGSKIFKEVQGKQTKIH